MLKTIVILALFLCLGESISYAFHLTVPGAVIGMLLLFSFLTLRPSVAATIESTALRILRHFSLLFIPAGVGIMTAARTVSSNVLPLVAAVVVSTTLAIAVTAVVTHVLLGRQRRLLARRERIR